MKRFLPLILLAGCAGQPPPAPVAEIDPRQRITAIDAALSEIIGLLAALQTNGGDPDHVARLEAALERCRAERQALEAQLLEQQIRRYE